MISQIIKYALFAFVVLNASWTQNCYSDEDCENGSVCIPPFGDCNFENNPGHCAQLSEDCNEEFGIGYCDCEGNYIEDLYMLACIGGGVDYIGDCILPCEENICIDWIENNTILEEDALFYSAFHNEYIGWTYEINQDTIWIRQSIPHFEGEKQYELILVNTGPNGLPEFVQFSIYEYWVNPFTEIFYELEFGQIEIQDWDFNELHTGRIINQDVDQPAVINFWSEIPPEIGDECNLDDGSDGYLDCNLNCQPTSDLYIGLGNIECQNSDLLEMINFDCIEFGYDCGDCNSEWDGTGSLGFCSDNFTQCSSNYSCPTNFVCIPAEGDCDFNDNQGECIFLGDICSDETNFVCGCDGTTYQNSCLANIEGQVGLLYYGECNPNDFGCTNSNALNFNPDAIEDDGSCEYQYSEFCDFIYATTGCPETGCPINYECWDNPNICSPSSISCNPITGELIESLDCNGLSCHYIGPQCYLDEDCPEDNTCVPSIGCNMNAGNGMCIYNFEPIECPYLSGYSFEVCGCDKQTYRSYCEANFYANTGVEYFGECEPSCDLYGDVNEDGEINVSDIILVICFILDEPNCAGNSGCANTNPDFEINVVDIVNIVNMILGE